MRPINETEEDLENERAVMAEIANRWNCCYTKLPMSEHLDYELFRKFGDPIGRIEIKCRTESYDPLWLSFAKFCAGVHYSALSRKRFFIAYRIPPGKIIWYEHKDGKFNMKQNAGRTDRGQEGDVEPCVELPLVIFKPL